jgi:hypothetical protein
MFKVRCLIRNHFVIYLFYFIFFCFGMSVKTSHIYFNSIHVIIKRTNNERKKQTKRMHLGFASRHSFSYTMTRYWITYTYRSPDVKLIVNSAQFVLSVMFICLFLSFVVSPFYYYMNWIKINMWSFHTHTKAIPGHSIWKRMPWGEAEMHSFSYTNEQVLYNQFSPYFLCGVSWLPITTNLGSLSHRHFPLFSNFLFINLFSIKFLYFFIISSLFPYLNLFMSIFIHSYASNNLH